MMSIDSVNRGIQYYFLHKDEKKHWSNLLAVRNLKVVSFAAQTVTWFVDWSLRSWSINSTYHIHTVCAKNIRTPSKIWKATLRHALCMLSGQFQERTVNHPFQISKLKRYAKSRLFSKKSEDGRLNRVSCHGFLTTSYIIYCNTTVVASYKELYSGCRSLSLPRAPCASFKTFVATTKVAILIRMEPIKLWMRDQTCWLFHSFAWHKICHFVLSAHLKIRCNTVVYSYDLYRHF